MKSLTKNITLALGIAMAIVACSQAKDKTESLDETDTSNALESNQPYESVTTQLMSTSGSNLTGEVTFDELENGKISITVELDGVAPGNHAVHIHETGDCSAADGSSAGGHWNPMNVEHGNRMVDDDFHKGDIGNLTVYNDSTGTMTMEIEGWTLGGENESNILGKAVIVHAGADDFTSQPSGAAGDRIGCAVIND